MSTGESVRLAFAYSKWSESNEGKAYIVEHGDPYAEDRKKEAEAAEWFAEREIAALHGPKGPATTPNEDIRPMMVFQNYCDFRQRQEYETIFPTPAYPN